MTSAPGAENSALSELIHRGREQRNLEYKGAGDWNSLKAKITQCCLAMANLRDGGWIVVGVTDSSCEPVGLSPPQLDSFRHDEIGRYVNARARPDIALYLYKYTELENGRSFAIINVSEFSIDPVICSKSGVDFQEGRMYWRRSAPVESAPVQTEAAMREIMELATEKGVRGFVQRATAAGVLLASSPASTDRAAFDQQLEPELLD